MSLIFVVGALIFSSSFFSGVGWAQRIIEWKTYTDPKLGISLQYPSDWTIKQKANRFDPDPDLLLETRNQLGGNNSLAINARNLPVNISITSGQFVAEKLKDVVTYEGIREGKDIHIIQDVTKHYPIDGHEVFSFIVAESTSRPSVQIVEEGITVLNLQTQKIFAFGFTALSSHYDDPDQVQIRDHILKSIKFIEVAQ
jgi:hypothetical protein